MKLLKVLLASLVLASSTVTAGVIDTLTGWGINTSVINQYENVAASNYHADGFTYVVEDFVGNAQYSDWVGPNRGGQRYDLEAMYVRQSGSILTIAGITGALWNQRGTYNFGIGDLFIGQRDANNAFYGYGIELTGATYLMNSTGNTVASIASPIGSLYGVTANGGYADGISSSRWDQNAAPGQLVYSSLGDGFNDGTPETPATWLMSSAANIQWEQFSGNKHSAFIATIDMSTMPNIMNQWNGNMLVHWGEACANDYLEVSVNTVPLPASGLLVGVGLVALWVFS